MVLNIVTNGRDDKFKEFVIFNCESNKSTNIKVKKTGDVKFVDDSDYIFDRSFTMSLGFFPAKNNSMFFKTLLPIATLLCDVDELICGNSTTFSASNNLGLT